MLRRQNRSLDEQALPSMHVQVPPDGQLPQGEVEQVEGMLPLERPPLLPSPPLLVVVVLHWQVAVSQVVPVAQLPPQFEGQTQLLLAPQVAGGPQGGLQVSATQTPFTQESPAEQPLGPQPEVPPSPAVHAPLVVLQT
jgi:hypothetical protein